MRRMRGGKGDDLVLRSRSRAAAASGRRVDGPGYGPAPRGHAPLLQINAGDAFVEARRRRGVAITELYRVRGFLQSAVKPAECCSECEQRLVPAVDMHLHHRRPQTIGQTRRGGGQRGGSTGDTLRSLLVADGGRPLSRPQLAADREAIERANSIRLPERRGELAASPRGPQRS